MSEPTMEELGEYENHEKWVSLKVKCGQCSHTTFTSRLRQFMPSASDILFEHLKQHEPGRAVDIEVDWEPSACCSVCDDGIGDIRQEDEGVTCLDCGTTWDLDGKGGERRERNENDR